VPLTDTSFSWTLRDYVSPGLRVVRPDDCFPHMRPGDLLHHPWKYLRRDVPHLWYADERYPLMGFLNRDEATLLHNIALQFAGKRALEIGSWLGWSTCHMALAGVTLDVIDPAHDDPAFRAIVEESIACCGVGNRVNFAGGRSPESIGQLGGKWSLFFIDGDHESPGPVRDALACLPYAAADCAFVFHDLNAPSVAAGLRALSERGFQVVLYQTAQIMGMAWRGDVMPVDHVPDPDVAWQMPPHLAGLPVSGVDFKPAARSGYRELRDSFLTPPRVPPATPSVCIVTSEIIGPFKNGGVGTATTGLAELLAAQGLPVTVLYTGNIWSPDPGLPRWKKHYAALGIDLIALSIQDMKLLAGPLKDRGFCVPWLVYRFLADRSFDVIHFNDCCGEGSLSLAAKRLGLAFRDSLLVVALHSPSGWVLELNQMLPANILFPAYHCAEQLSVACADLLWSPSRYLLDWVAARGFELPPQTFVQQYVLPRTKANGSDGAADRGATPPPREIVFFGRLEERKGLRLFCNAVHVLRDELAQRGITITFLGKAERCGGMPSLDYIAHRAASWTFPIKTITDLGQPEALDYLRRGGTLAVMPSPFDNSPCTVSEALSCGIPFLAARTGGIPELIDAADHEHVLFEHATESLVLALRNAIERGGWRATPSMMQEEIRRSWMALHHGWRAFLQPRAAVATPSTVAVIVDHPPGSRLDLTVDSLVKCPSVKRFVVLNRGGETLPMDNIDLMTTDPDAVVTALEAIVEDVVLLIHSGVAVVPNAFEAMLAALEPGIDGLIPAGRVFEKNGSRIVPPLGGSAAFSLFEGVTFTGAMLVRRQSLVAAKKGRSLALESPFLGLSDFCVADGGRIWPYPEAVLERSAECRIDVKNALPARVSAYGGASPNDHYYMLAAGYGAANQEPRSSLKRDMARAAVDLGLTSAVRIGSWAWRRLRRWIR
jgi:glycosyltransferase involved in cell wall biosynthesis